MNTEFFKNCCDEVEADLSYARNGEKGFSLIEVVVAMVIILIALLGVVQAITYAVVYNSGNKTRGQALVIMQQEVEFMRSKKFTPAFVDTELAGGFNPKIVTTPTGATFLVENEIDNEPLVDGIQDDTYTCLNPQGAEQPCSIKEITITVRLNAPSPGWQTAVPAKTVLRRTRGN